MEDLKMKKTKENAITLVVLVITIIVLLILSGVSIQAISNTGLFANAKKAKDESMKGQLQEEISLAIQSIQTEEIYKGNSVTLETLAGGQLEEALTDITAELDGDEINGEYKNYEYTIDSNLKVTINGEVSGAKIKGTAEVQICNRRNNNRNSSPRRSNNKNRYKCNRKSIYSKQKWDIHI